MRTTSTLILIAAFLAVPALAGAAPPGVVGPAGSLVAGASSRGTIAFPGTRTVVWNPGLADQSRAGRKLFLAVADTSGIGFEHVWARPTAGASTSGAVYFTVINQGSPDALVGASTPVAATAAVHESIDDQGIMKMRPVPSIALDPGKPVTLKPGGYHVMLTGLKGPLKPGDSFPLTLTFAHAPPVTVTAKVEIMSGAPADHGGTPAMPGMH